MPDNTGYLFMVYNIGTHVHIKLNAHNGMFGTNLIIFFLLEPINVIRIYTENVTTSN